MPVAVTSPEIIEARNNLLLNSPNANCMTERCTRRDTNTHITIGQPMIKLDDETSTAISFAENEFKKTAMPLLRISK